MTTRSFGLIVPQLRTGIKNHFLIATAWFKSWLWNSLFQGEYVLSVEMAIVSNDMEWVVWLSPLSHYLSGSWDCVHLLNASQMNWVGNITESKVVGWRMKMFCFRRKRACIACVTRSNSEMSSPSSFVGREDYLSSEVLLPMVVQVGFVTNNFSKYIRMKLEIWNHHIFLDTIT